VSSGEIKTACSILNKNQSIKNKAFNLLL